jgi:hypothetical protein
MVFKMRSLWLSWILEKDIHRDKMIAR